jgi:hypothetical protein
MSLEPILFARGRGCDSRRSHRPETRDILNALAEPVRVTYFHQEQNPAARALNTMLLQHERQNGNLWVRLVAASATRLWQAARACTSTTPLCRPTVAESRRSLPLQARARIVLATFAILGDFCYRHPASWLQARPFWGRTPLQLGERILL